MVQVMWNLIHGWRRLLSSVEMMDLSEVLDQLVKACFLCMY